MNLLHSSSNKAIQDSEIFHTKFIARLCVALACFIQFFARLTTLFHNSTISSKNGHLLLFSIPTTLLMTLTVVIEFLLFKKFGSRVVKYSLLFDLILLILFIADWALGVTSFLIPTQHSDPALFSINAVFGFIGFAWRALLVTLIVQKWQLKIIAPIIASLIATGFAIHYDTENYYFYTIRTIAQVFNIVLVLYCEDKIKWRMIWTNLQQEKWMQVNNFILNNIPENIMILDLEGKTQFISDYCRAFMNQCQNSLDTNSFFKKIRDLQPQYSPNRSAVALNFEKQTTGNELLTDINENPVNTLADLLANFKNIIKEENFQERQFLVYNGKMKGDRDDLANKSIEIKISFVKQYKSEHLILIIRDTTQRDLLITLEETNKYKDKLLASVSHELRAPLNGNINLVESAISSSKIPDQIKENLLVPALRSSKFLLHLINDILDMSQIKEKKLRLVFQSGDLKETLMSTAQLIELQAKKKGIILKVELDPTLPLEFQTDHVRLGQIVLNLLSNAIKFTKDGSVTLTAKSLNQAQWVKISVEDSGIGMSEENITKLFSNYTHIEFEERQSMNPSGVGLGLNITHNLVQLLAPKDHQNISVVSALNQGSAFSFIIENKNKIPIQLKELEDQRNDSNDSFKIPDESPVNIKPILFQKLLSPKTSLQKCLCPQILIVDDNPFNTMAFETLLGSLDIQCASAYNGSSTLETLLQYESKKCCKDCKLYSIVFMDQEMPGMSGADTVREIRRLQKEKELSQNLRIIGCTAHKSKEEVEKFLDAGLDKCIHKPISLTMVKSVL